MRNVEAASAGLLDQVEGLSELEGLGLVTVDLNLNEQIVSWYTLATDRLSCLPDIFLCLDVS